MTWAGADEHPQLLGYATALTHEAMGLRHRLEHQNQTEHAQHGELADRARDLALHLDAAMTLCQQDLYPSAFAILRTALEQILVDHLAFNARMWTQLIDNVDEPTFQSWEEHRAAGTAWTDVVKWHRSKGGRVEIVRQGLRSQPDDQGKIQTLSIYYFLLQQYSSLVGSPTTQEYFHDGIGDVERQREYAKENRLLYHRYLSWESIKSSLLANGFASESDKRVLDVHYRFLSGFVHPISNTTELVYGRNQFNIPTYDHYSSELILLYVAVFAAYELRNFREMTQHDPPVGITDWGRTESLCHEVWQTCSYLWFISHPPHQLDRIKEANRRVWENYRETKQLMPPINPASIPADEVRYYQDPLRRLVKLHQSATELTTGLGYRSPWERRDAQFR